MALPWLRLYTEIQDDPVINLMPEAMRWRYIMLLCTARKTDNSGKVTNETLSFQWRISVDQVKETKKLFVANNLITEDWKIPTWDGRQPPSDSSSERSRKSREKKNSTVAATLQDRYQHGTDKSRGDVAGRVNGFDATPSDGRFFGDDADTEIRA